MKNVFELNFAPYNSKLSVLKLYLHNCVNVDVLFTSGVNPAKYPYPSSVTSIPEQ